MVKIKIKKEMNFPELVQWVWDNNIIDKTYSSDNHNLVYFDKSGDVTRGFEVGKSDVFTLEVEEEVTEETKVPLLLEIFTNITQTNTRSQVFYDTSIQSVWSNDDVITSKTFHMIHPDGTTTLLWTKEGGMQ